MLIVVNKFRLVEPHHAHFNCSSGFFRTAIHSKNISKEISCNVRTLSTHAWISCLVMDRNLTQFDTEMCFNELTFYYRVFVIAFKTDFWVYPVLAVLHWGYRLLFIVGLMVLAAFMYFSGEKLHYAVWGKIG